MDYFLLDVHLLPPIISPFIAALVVPGRVVTIVNPVILLIARLSLGSGTVLVDVFVVHRHGWIPYSLTLPGYVVTVRLALRLGAGRRVV